MLNNQVLISKAQIKFIRSLHDKKHRIEEGLFIVEGEKIIVELLNSPNNNIHSVFAVNEFIVRYANQLKRLSSEKVHLINEKELAQISNLQSPNLALVVVHFAATKAIEIQTVKKYILLDNIKDPGNLGTIIRTADWYGIDTIFCSPDCVESTNPKVIQATMGSFFRVNICEVSLSDLIEQHKSITTYGAVLEGENVYNTEFNEGGFLVIGSESHGISEELKTLIDKKIRIPSIGKAESLNASIATAILCSEWARQVNFKI